MKKYMLFQFNMYYPDGGIRDFAIAFDSFGEFFKEYKYGSFEFYQLVKTTDFSHELLRFSEASNRNKKELFAWVESQIKNGFK